MVDIIITTPSRPSSPGSPERVQPCSLEVPDKKFGQAIRAGLLSFSAQRALRSLAYENFGVDAALAALEAIYACIEHEIDAKVRRIEAEIELCYKLVQLQSPSLADELGSPAMTPPNQRFLNPKIRQAIEDLITSVPTRGTGAAVTAVVAEIEENMKELLHIRQMVLFKMSSWVERTKGRGSRTESSSPPATSASARDGCGIPSCGQLQSYL